MPRQDSFSLRMWSLDSPAAPPQTGISKSTWTGRTGTGSDTVTIQQSAPPLAVFPQDVAQDLNWSSSFYYELGATRHLGEQWSLSAGFIYNQDSVPDENDSPLIADVDKDSRALGCLRG